MSGFHAPARRNEESELLRVLDSFQTDSEARVATRSSIIMRADSRSPSVDPSEVVDPTALQAELSAQSRRRSSDTSLTELSGSRMNSSSIDLVRSFSTSILETSVFETVRKTGRGSPAEKRVQWKKRTQVKLTGVREDFYSTLVSSYSSWSTHSVPDLADPEAQRLQSEISRDTISAVTNYCIRIWSLQLGFGTFMNPNPSALTVPLYETPTCLSQSNLGFLLVAYHGGVVVLRDLLNEECCCAVFTSDAVSLFEAAQPTHAGMGYTSPWKPQAPRMSSHVTSCVWAVCTPATHSAAVRSAQAKIVTRCGRNVEGFVGDDQGRVFKFVVVLEHEGLRLRIVASTPSDKHHTESICSMALNNGEKLLCVGAGDCMVRVWHHDCHETQQPLALKAEIPHYSAVRATSFCPAMPRLLLTGGGRHDRVLRMFDVNQKAPLCEINMPAQIVGIVFVSKLEAFVALGHSRLKKYRGLGKIVNVLSGKVLAEIPGEGYALTALKTQSGFCINTSLKDLITYTWEAEAGVRRLSTAAMEAAYSLSLPVAVLR